MSAIEWTTRTWNPVTGCDRCSPGCSNCYALTMAGRLKAMGSAKYQSDGDPRTSGPGFAVTCHADVLDQPLRWRKPSTVFVNSMSDLFHPDVPDEFILRVWCVMEEARRHTFQVLTKRPRRMRSWVTERYLSYAAQFDACPTDAMRTSPAAEWADTRSMHGQPNVWLGTSIENARYAFRAIQLKQTPAAVHFLSLEPLLGPMPGLGLGGIEWVIVGAESGRGARPMDEGWVREIRDNCVDAGVPFFYKQRAVNGRKVSLPELDGQQWTQMPTAAVGA